MERADFRKMKMAGMLLLMLGGWAGGLASADSKREKAIDFDDQVVEGMNRRPLDSLQQNADARDPRRRSHLYKFRRGFSGETELTVKDMRWSR